MPHPEALKCLVAINQQKDNFDSVLLPRTLHVAPRYCNRRVLIINSEAVNLTQSLLAV